MRSRRSLVDLLAGIAGYYNYVLIISIVGIPLTLGVRRRQRYRYKMPDSPKRGPLSARLAETYRQLRTSTNATQAEFAEMLEIDRERVQAMESAGRANQTVDTFQSLAYALGLSAWQLLKIAEENESLDAVMAYRQANQKRGLDADLQAELMLLLEQKAERHTKRKRSERKAKKSETPEDSGK